MKILFSLPCNFVIDTPERKATFVKILTDVDLIVISESIKATYPRFISTALNLISENEELSAKTVILPDQILDYNAYLCALQLLTGETPAGAIFSTKQQTALQSIINTLPVGPATLYGYDLGGLSTADVMITHSNTLTT